MNSLQDVLKNLIQSGSQANPALNALINDYTQYHVVFVVLGGLITTIFMALSVYFVYRWWRVPRSAQRRWTFEKTIFFSFGILSLLLGLLMGLIVAANTSNVFDLEHGFSLVVDSLETAKTGTSLDTLRQAFNTWLQTGSSATPSVIQSKLDERTVFHTAKAMVCGLLLIVFLGFSLNLWRTLIKHFREQGALWRLKERLLFVGGMTALPVMLLLLIMALANTQAAVAHTTLTLIYG